MSWTYILAFVLLIIFIASGVLITASSVNLNALKDTDPDFKNAYYYSTVAAVVTWILVALAIILIIVYYYFYFETGGELAAVSNLTANNESSGIGIIIFLIIILILITIIGILAARTAYYIDQSTNYNPNIPQQYRAREESIVTAVLCLGSGGLLFIWFIIDLIYYLYPEEKDIKLQNKKEKNIKLEKDIKLENIKEKDVPELLNK